MTHNWKRFASVAYGYSLTRLAFNTYMYYEERQMNREDYDETQQKLDQRFWNLISLYLKGENPSGELKVLREEICQKMELVIGITDCFRSYEYALNRVERRFITDLPAIPVTDEELVDRVMGYITAERDSMVMNQRIQEVIGQLPLRLTRQKYYGMVEEAMKAYVGADRDSLDREMYLLRTAGMVALTEDEKAQLPEIRDMLKTLEQISFRDMTSESFHKARQLLVLASERLSTLSDYGQTIQNLVNDLLVLAETQEDAMRSAEEEKHALHILAEICRFVETNSGDLEELDPDLSALEGVQENLYEKYQRFNLDAEPQSGEDEMMVRMRQIDRLLSDSLFAPLEDSAMQSEEVSQEILAQVLQSYREETEPLFSMAQKPIVRAIMATTLSALPVFFVSLDEVKSFIAGSLDGCTDLAEKEACRELLMQLVESEDYAF